MKIVLVALLLFMTCFAFAGKKAPAIETVKEIKEIDLEAYLSQSNRFFIIDDIDGDNENKLVTADFSFYFYGDYNLIINIYKKSSEKWVLAKSFNGVDALIMNIMSFSEYYEKDLFLPVNKPKNYQLLALDVDGIPGKEILVPYSGPSTCGIVFLRVSESNISQIADVTGCDYINYYDGKMVFVGHPVGDFAWFDTQNYKYYYYENEGGKFVEHAPLPPVLYQDVLNSKSEYFNQNPEFSKMYDICMFQYAQGYKEEALEWFTKHKKQIRDTEYLEMFENFLD